MIRCTKWAIAVAAKAVVVIVVGTSVARADIGFNLFDNSGYANDISGYTSLYSRKDYSGYVAQKFNTGSGGTLTEVFLALMRSSTTNNDATFDLYVAPDDEGTPGEPTGWSAVATGINIVGNLVQTTHPNDDVVITADLRNKANWYSNASLTPVVLPADSTYWLVVSAITVTPMTDGLLQFGRGAFTGAQNAGSSGPNPQLFGTAAWSNDELEWFTGTVSQGMGLEIVAPVPEPSTYAMALAGLACGSYALRRRRRSLTGGRRPSTSRA